MTTHRAVHAVPLEPDPAGREHLPFTRCWCGPVDGFRDLATTAPVYVHRRPPPAPMADRHAEEVSR